MDTTESTFFQGKRPWSMIKDRVIGRYLTVYIQKVSKLGKPILFIDGFAGPGVFEDGSDGSPVIICKVAEKSGKQWSAIFVNNNRNHHNQLHSVIIDRGWERNAKPICGQSADMLKAIHEILTDQTVFIYLDPFGLKGFSFSALVPYLERVVSGHSIEIVLNISMPTLHRLAAVHAASEGETTRSRIRKLNQTLSDALGGDWWQDIMWRDDNPDQKENEVIRCFCERLAEFLPYTGYCPVQENADADVKYYITFASRHQDAQLLMNDMMCEAYEDYIFYTRGAGVQRQLWGLEDERAFNMHLLDQVILETVGQNPGRSREDIWKIIVPNYFMRWTEKEYKRQVKELANDGKLIYRRDPITERHNRHSLLDLP